SRVGPATFDAVPLTCILKKHGCPLHLSKESLLPMLASAPPKLDASVFFYFSSTLLLSPPLPRNKNTPQRVNSGRGLNFWLHFSRKHYKKYTQRLIRKEYHKIA
ncbi:unnamed protein product, partial [Ectocarpus fasciculatus]